MCAMKIFIISYVRSRMLLSPNGGGLCIHYFPDNILARFHNAWLTHWSFEKANPWIPDGD